MQVELFGGSDQLYPFHENNKIERTLCKFRRLKQDSFSKEKFKSAYDDPEILEVI